MNKERIRNLLADSIDKLSHTINNVPSVLQVDNKLLQDSLKKKSDDTFYNKAKYVVFDSHPETFNETYGEHFEGSMHLAYKSILAFFIFVVHAIFPIVFTNTGTEILKDTIEYSENKGIKLEVDTN